MGSEEIIDAIHEVVSRNVIGDKQLLSRYKGFRAELFLEKYIEKKYPKYKQLNGGIIISADSSESSLINAIYFTLIPESEFLKDYEEIYNRVSQIGFGQMYIIQYSGNDWTEQAIMKFGNSEIILPVAELKVYSFHKGKGFVLISSSPEVISNNFVNKPKREKNKYPISPFTKEWLYKNLRDFDTDRLLQIYMERVFLDGYIGFGKERGKPSEALIKEFISKGTFETGSILIR